MGEIRWIIHSVVCVLTCLLALFLQCSIENICKRWVMNQNIYFRRILIHWIFKNMWKCFFSVLFIRFSSQILVSRRNHCFHVAPSFPTVNVNSSHCWFIVMWRIYCLFRFHHLHFSFDSAQIVDVCASIHTYTRFFSLLLFWMKHCQMSESVPIGSLFCCELERAFDGWHIAQLFRWKSCRETHAEILPDALH